MPFGSILTGCGEVGQEDQQVGDTRDTITIEVGGAGIAIDAGAQTCERVPGRAGATEGFLEVVADAVAVVVGFAFAIADADGVGHIAVAVAGAWQQVFTSATVDRTRPVAHPTGVELAYAVVVLVTQAITIEVDEAIARTVQSFDGVYAAAVRIGRSRVEVACRRIRATRDDGAVTDAVTIGLGIAVAFAIGATIGKVAGAIVVRGFALVIACGRLSATGHLIRITYAITIGVTRAITTAIAEGIELLAFTIAVFGGYHGAATFENGPGTIAHPAGIEGAHAGIHIVTDAIPIRIRRAISAAVAEGIELVTVAIAVTDGPLRTTALKHRTGAIAQSAFIQCANAGVDIVAIPVAIAIGRASPTADAHDIEVEAVAIVLRGVRVVVARVGVGTASVDALAGDVGLWVIVVRLGVGTARVETTGIHIGLRIVVVRVRIGAAYVLTRF